jgi:hypothetical protein
VLAHLYSPRGAAAALALVGVVVVVDDNGVDIGAAKGGGRSEFADETTVVAIAGAAVVADSVGSVSVGVGRVAEGCSCLMYPTGFEDEIMPGNNKGCFFACCIHNGLF